VRPLDSLFDLDKGHQLALNRVERANSIREGVAYVARSHRNNGITAWVRPIAGLEPASAGDISVCLRSRNHSMAAFVQPRPFYTTYHVAILTPKQPMTVQEKLWWCMCIRANQFRFHFGRQANRTVGSLLLPDEAPQWAIETVPPHHASAVNPNDASSIDLSKWDSFPILDLFSAAVGPHTTRRDLGRGSTPLVTASAWNNGITGTISASPDWEGGQITVANNGSIGAAFYQPRPFTASRDVTVLTPKFEGLSTASALFICTVLRKESARFNYARKWNAGRMRQSSIRLPAKAGAPDVQAMENLMRALPLGWVLS